MTRTLYLACLILLLSDNSPAASEEHTARIRKARHKTAHKRRQTPDEDNPPEEDESVAPRVYPLDPLESDRTIRIGNFYMHQGKVSGYRAALGRYEDATKYNPTSAEAFFKLGKRKKS